MWKLLVILVLSSFKPESIYLNVIKNYIFNTEVATLATKVELKVAYDKILKLQAFDLNLVKVTLKMTVLKTI